MQQDLSGRHHVVVVGGGFGGLSVVQNLLRANVRITIIDRNNHHLFQPLLYQAATASLAPYEIAWPIRRMFRNRMNVTTLLATVQGVERDQRQLVLEDGSRLAYDTLVLATGARHAYFGHEDWEAYAPGLKSVEDAVALRDRFLMALEAAEQEPDPGRRAFLLTFVVIGGGPTGVELAGALAEFAQSKIHGEYRNVDTHKIRIVLIDAGKRVLPTFDEKLSDYAKASLERLGVIIELGQAVSDCSAQSVTYGQTELKAGLIIWAAGVKASDAAQWVGAKADRAGRAIVESDLTIAGSPDIFVIGDTASVSTPDGHPVPGVAPAAKQQGQHVASVIRRRLSGDASSRPFKYKHFGDIATIGGRRAVIDFGKVKLRGALAWWVWGLAHIYFLVNFRNRLNVAMSWLWFLTRDERTARVIVEKHMRKSKL
ncbi:MAG: NAD(P)/FAD-dependent oxidoreductase [Xanthobacter sp.]